jgi:hypothetical protein
VEVALNGIIGIGSVSGDTMIIQKIYVSMNKDIIFVRDVDMNIVGLMKDDT